MAAPKTYSIIIVPSDHSGTRQFRISRTLLITSILVLVLVVVTMTIFAATYTTVLSEARRAQQLELENQDLRDQVAQVNDLSRELESLSALRAQVLNMLGTDEDDLEPTILSQPAPGADPEAILDDTGRLQQLFAEQARKPFAPRAWPAEGRVRKEFFAEPEGSQPAHPGLAIEVHAGEPVRAAARGQVLSVDSDDPSDQRVEIDHGYGFRTVYGGLTRVDVDPGQIVERLQGIGRLGMPPGDDRNGGSRIADRALYFELRVDGSPVDPRSYLTPR